jgi:hypothetical protein
MHPVHLHFSAPRFDLTDLFETEQFCFLFLLSLQQKNDVIDYLSSHQRPRLLLQITISCSNHRKVKFLLSLSKSQFLFSGGILKKLGSSISVVFPESTLRRDVINFDRLVYNNHAYNPQVSPSELLILLKNDR